MSDLAREDRLVQLVLLAVRRALEPEGLLPQDPLVGRILATLLGTHYRVRGGHDDDLRNEILVDLWDAMNKADDVH